jgi:hypothetical protein
MNKKEIEIIKGNKCFLKVGKYFKRCGLNEFIYIKSYSKYKKMYRCINFGINDKNYLYFNSHYSLNDEKFKRCWYKQTSKKYIFENLFNFVRKDVLKLLKDIIDDNKEEVKKEVLKDE